MPRYMVKIDDTEYDIELSLRGSDLEVTVNGRKVDVVRSQLQNSRALLLINGETLEVDVRSNGYDTRRLVFTRGQEIGVEVEDYNLAQLRKAAGMSSGPALEKKIKAPMPGLVLDLKVRPGDNVKQGQALVVIEAMKMENVIKAQGDGTVKEIFVEPGQSVEKEDKLLELE